MKTIITIQHTQAVHHTNGMVGSWTDWKLTEEGINQAKNIGEKLKRELAEKEFVIYSSDLLRAKQTAENVGSCLGVTPVLRSELRERNLGKEFLISLKEVVTNLFFTILFLPPFEDFY